MTTRTPANKITGANAGAMSVANFSVSGRPHRSEAVERIRFLKTFLFVFLRNSHADLAISQFFHSFSASSLDAVPDYEKNLHIDCREHASVLWMFEPQRTHAGRESPLEEFRRQCQCRSGQVPACFACARKAAWPVQRRPRGIESKSIGLFGSSPFSVVSDFPVREE